MSAFSRLSCTLSAQARTTRRHISKLRRKTVDFSPKVGTFSKKAHDFQKKIVDFCAKAIPYRAKRGKGGKGEMKNRRRNKSGSLFSRGRKERAEKKRGSGGRLCLVDRPAKAAGRGNSKTSEAKRGRSPAQKGVSAPLFPLRLPNARRRCRAPRSYRRRQPATFPARSARPICGRGDFRIRPAHKWHW